MGIPQGEMTNCNYVIAGLKINFFLFDWSFNRIAVHLLHLRVLAVHKSPVLSSFCWKLSLFQLNLFTLFHSIFFSITMHCILVPNTLEIQSKTSLALSQSGHWKRLLNAIAHKHNPFIYPSISIQSST